MIDFDQLEARIFYSERRLLINLVYSSFLSADVMKKVGAQTIIAIDVGSEYSDSLVNYGDQLSGWWLLWNKWNPFAESLKVLSP